MDNLTPPKPGLYDRRSSLLTACFAANRIASLVRIQSLCGKYILDGNRLKEWINGLPSGDLDNEGTQAQ